MRKRNRLVRQSELLPAVRGPGNVLVARDRRVRCSAQAEVIGGFSPVSVRAYAPGLSRGRGVGRRARDNRKRQRGRATGWRLGVCGSVGARSRGDLGWAVASARAYWAAPRGRDGRVRAVP